MLEDGVFSGHRDQQHSASVSVEAVPSAMVAFPGEFPHLINSSTFSSFIV